MNDHGKGRVGLKEINVVMVLDGTFHKTYEGDQLLTFHKKKRKR